MISPAIILGRKLISPRRTSAVAGRANHPSGTLTE